MRRGYGLLYGTRNQPRGKDIVMVWVSLYVLKLTSLDCTMFPIVWHICYTLVVHIFCYLTRMLLFELGSVTLALAQGTSGRHVADNEVRPGVTRD